VRFAADKMLGRLARWLRIVGQDVAYGPHLSGTTLLRMARHEGRTILTRDTRLLRRRDLPPHLAIASDDFRQQLRQVLSAFSITCEPRVLLTRCLDCNTELCEVDRVEARPHVPPYVWETQQRFSRCPRCRRILWPATHLARIRDELRRLELLDGGD
jgi:hypothetical protein